MADWYDNVPAPTDANGEPVPLDTREMTLEMRDAPAEVVDSPSWYTSGGVETIEKIERVIDGLPAVQAYALGQVLRYFDRAGRKDATETDLGKANNYAHRLVTGKWRDDDE